MKAIKNVSVGIADYYRNLRDRTELELERSRISYDELKEVIAKRRNDIVPNINKFRLPVIDYPEFQQNKYINGRLENAAKSMYQDERLNLEDKHIHFRLVSYAVNLRKMAEYEAAIAKYEKILALSFNQYRDFLRSYYTEVQNQLILKGNGYRFSGKLGWICINRVINTGKLIVDFKATKANKEKLIAEGKRIYNEDEAKWCEDNGIPYDGIKPTVYKQDECWYELALMAGSLPNRLDLKIKPIDYRSVPLRKYTNAQLIELCDGDKEKICKLDLSMKIKLTLCLQADKTLYTKFIRNENQTKSNFGQSAWKNRQRLQS